MFKSRGRQLYASRYSVQANQRVCSRAWPVVMHCLAVLKETAANEAYPKTAELAGELIAARGTPVRVFGGMKVAVR